MTKTLTHNFHSVYLKMTKIFPLRPICCLKHTSHTGEHSLIPARGKDGLGMRLHRQVTRAIYDYS